MKIEDIRLQFQKLDSFGEKFKDFEKEMTSFVARVRRRQFKKWLAK